VDQLASGMPGHRIRLPERVHPVSAGVRGGIAGGLLMPLPALAYGVISGRGIWLPINLLAGMVLPGMDELPTEELSQFHIVWFVVALCIHAVISLALGLIYGVLLPTLPRIPGGQLVWGGVLLPLLWTGVSYGMMGVINPVLNQHVDWPWFVLSQFVFGVAAAVVVIRSEQIHIPPAGPGPGPFQTT
jgi:hypothetical protein